MPEETGFTWALIVALEQMYAGGKEEVWFNGRRYKNSPDLKERIEYMRERLLADEAAAAGTDIRRTRIDQSDEG